MKKVLEQVKYLICNDIAENKTFFVVENSLPNTQNLSWPVAQKSVINIQDINIRSEYRKALKNESTVTFFDGDAADFLKNNKCDVALLGDDCKDVLTFVSDFCDKAQTLVVPYSNPNEEETILINKAAEFYAQSINYTYKKKGGYCDFSLSSNPVQQGQTGVILFSNDLVGAKDGYTFMFSDDSAEIKHLKELYKQEADKCYYYLTLIFGFQSKKYLILGPLRVLKRAIIESRLYSFFAKVTRIIKSDGISALLGKIKNRVFSKTETISEDGYAHLFANKNEYVDIDSEYQENIDFSDKDTDVKMLAYYLPQFHAFKENDEWWGKGFTEWSNTKVATPRFSGHYQPRTPHSDIGYYDLSCIETLKKQIELAKQHGIYGFCFYYYWFSGKRLMEKPVDMLLEHKEIDFPFCLCWANENWTRAWDGQNKSVLIAQDYSDKDDERFMEDMKKYIDDSRYIRINGKPLVIVYNPGQIPDCEKNFDKWRQKAKEIGIGDIIIWICRTSNNTAKSLGIEEFIDAEIEFPPHNTWLNDFAIHNIDLNGQSAFLFNYQKMVDGIIYDYKTGKDLKTGSKPVHHACMMSWDNAARRKKDWFTYHNFSLRSLYNWVLTICEQARRDFDKEERFVFINAWNEWAEGTYLEPDEKYGYANINTVSKALMGMPFEDDLTVINKDDQEIEGDAFKKKIAIQIHMFYTETLDETIENINHMPYDFDCFVTTDTQEKADYIKTKLDKECKCKNAFVELFANKGRDVAPFLLQMSNRIDEYDYICHIHSKRTVTGDHGNDWRRYIFKHLFGSEDYLKKIFNIFETNQKIGIIFPETFPPLEYQAEWGGNLAGCKALLTRLGVDCELPQTPVFPVGNMFWAKTEAIRKMFLCLNEGDFPEEAKQVNATIMHCIERCWVYLVQEYGYTYIKVFNNITEKIEEKNKKRIAFYVHYDKDNIVSKSDFNSLVEYKNSFDEIVFISNSKISEEDKRRISEYTTKIILRENKNFDFGAWKEGLEQYGYDNLNRFDQVALINNSTFAPIYKLDNVFLQMEQRDCDFWGITLFPEIKGNDYLNTDSIHEHIQSFFVVFEKSIIDNNDIKSFFDTFDGAESFKDAVAKGEVALTEHLSKKGYSYLPYITESYYICNYLLNYSIPYDKPTTLALLGSPLIKKKAYQYMSSAERIKLEQFVSKLNKSDVLKN